MKKLILVLTSAVLFCSLASRDMLGDSLPKSARAAKEINACALLTSSEIQQVQGEAVKETRPETPPASGMKLSECLFATTTPSKSVSVLLALPAPDNRSGVRRFWQERFRESATPKQPRQPSASRNPKQESEEDEVRNAQPVKGIGDQAYWTSNGKTSALYVLQGDLFLRMSVGGVRDETERLKRSKTLARAAVKRIAQSD